MFNKKGFTLIELVMVIVIIAILAVVAIPKYFDLANDAKLAAELGVVGGVRAGIYTYYAKNKVFPATLDTNADGVCDTCFSTVLESAVKTDWTKTSSNTYTGPRGLATYTYSVGTGQFTD